MKCAAAERLLALNYEFYALHGTAFSSTRQRLQPGVRRLVERLRGDESVLDLGCGNGALARELARRQHRGPYLGVDFSDELLQDARKAASGLQAQFVRTDLLRLSQPQPSESCPDRSGAGSPASPMGAGELPAEHAWTIVTAFAVLHHVPGEDVRQRLLRAIRSWMHPEGRLFVSNWQFLQHPRLAPRILPWSTADLDPADLDKGDYLLDWRHGAPGQRYVHQFDESELADLATNAGFVVSESFYSDGIDRRSGLYQVWKPDEMTPRG